MIPVFITGTGTGVGKTIVSVIVSNALKADYWKPVQSGSVDGTDSREVSRLMAPGFKCLPEVYSLLKPASPHIAAREENIVIDTGRIHSAYESIRKDHNDADFLVIEGAGGLMVPLNDHEFMLDLILTLNARVILVSRNYLGSINHSLLTAEVCRQRGVDVIGWVFNDEYMQYQEEIVSWSGYPLIGSIPALTVIDGETLSGYGIQFRKKLLQLLEK